jgi:hypothetical protein
VKVKEEYGLVVVVQGKEEPLGTWERREGRSRLRVSAGRGGEVSERQRWRNFGRTHALFGLIVDRFHLAHDCPCPLFDVLPLPNAPD